MMKRENITFGSSSGKMLAGTMDVFEGDDGMAISDKDREMMKQVADYFESTRKADDPKAKYKPKREDSRSVNDTAAHFRITRAKAI